MGHPRQWCRLQHEVTLQPAVVPEEKAVAAARVLKAPREVQFILDVTDAAVVFESGNQFRHVCRPRDFLDRHVRADSVAALVAAQVENIEVVRGWLAGCVRRCGLTGTAQPSVNGDDPGRLPEERTHAGERLSCRNDALLGLQQSRAAPAHRHLAHEGH